MRCPCPAGRALNHRGRYPPVLITIHITKHHHLSEKTRESISNSLQGEKVKLTTP